MQTQPNTYKAKWLENLKYSLVDDKGEVKALLIGNDLVSEFDWLKFSPDGNGRIRARHEGKWYGFTADLTPITLPIKGDLVTAFDWLEFYVNGRIRAEYKGKCYGFNADLTPIRLLIGEEQVTAFDWLVFSRDGRIEKAKHGGKFYDFNADLTPIILKIKGKPRIARFYDWLSNIVSKHILVLLFVIFLISLCLRYAFIGGDFLAGGFVRTLFLVSLGYGLADSLGTLHRTRLERNAWRQIATTASGNPFRTYAINYLKRNGVNVDGVDVTATNSVSETDKK